MTQAEPTTEEAALFDSGPMEAMVKVNHAYARNSKARTPKVTVHPSLNMNQPMQIPADYGYVVMSTAIVGFVQFGIGGSTMGHRKIFGTEEFKNKKEVQALQEEHKKATGGEIDPLGYPDMGNGRYAQLLSYADWLTFNKAQRIHYSMVEVTGPVCASMVATGLYYPRTVAALGLSFTAGRILYAMGYMTNPKNRAVGAIVADLSFFAIWVASFVGGLTATGWIKK